MEKPIEVTAEVIEEEGQESALAVKFQPAEITADFDGIRAKVEAMIEPYEGITPEAAAAMDVKEAKACRADLRKISKALDDSRKAIKKAYQAPLKEFEAKVKEIDALIAEPCQVIDKATKDHEEAERQGRYMALAQVFADFVPEGIAENIGFDRILDDKWLNKSFGEKKAENALTDKVAAILADWESFKKTKGQLRFPDECEREFWRTLSLRSVNELDARLADEQARIDAMNAEIEEAQAYQQQAEPDVYERSEVPKIVQDDGQQVPYAVIDNQEPATWCFSVSLTRKQKDLVIDYLQSIGVHGWFNKALNYTPQELYAVVTKTLERGIHA